MKKILCLIFVLMTLLMMQELSAYAEKAVFGASASGEIYIHISPNKDSYVLEIVPACTQMNLIKKEDTWGLVSINNKTGWVNLSFTRDSYDLAAEATGYDSVKNVATLSHLQKTVLYNLPSADEKAGSKEKYSVPAGTVLKIIRETASGWALVPMNKDYAWVQIENTASYKTETEQQVSDLGIYYVYTLSESKEGTKLYLQNRESSVLRVIPDCTKLTVRESNGDYLYTSYDGNNGWVRASDTTKSLADAQANTGTEVNEEYISEKTADIYNVPSDSEVDGAVVIGSIELGKRIFVQRITFDGWMLINHDGIIGWIPPESAVPILQEADTVVSVFDKFLKGYISGEKNTGAKMYASYDKKEIIVTMPECVEVGIIAEENGCCYVKSDYASGWVDKNYITNDYQTAVSTGLLDEKQEYVTIQKAYFMSLPAEAEMYNSKKLMEVKTGVEFTVIRIVTTDKTQWGYTEINGKKGWINLQSAEKKLSNVKNYIYVGALTLLAVLIVAVLLLIKILKKGKQSDEKEVL